MPEMPETEKVSRRRIVPRLNGVHLGHFGRPVAHLQLVVPVEDGDEETSRSGGI
jgi:hypothetical protein